MEQIFQIICAYNISMEDLQRVCRLAAIIDTERGPGFTEKLLIKSYSRYLKFLERQ